MRFERFLIECLETKTKALQWPITTNENNTMYQSELGANIRNRRQTRENAYDQVAIGFGFASDWLKRWREIFKPIIEHSKVKPKQCIQRLLSTLNLKPL